MGRKRLHDWEDLTVKVLKLFYRTQLRPDEEFIDNRDLTIANELQIPKWVVVRILEKESENHLKRIKIKYNHENALETGIR